MTIRYICRHSERPYRPYDIGMNAAKRVARLADERAQKLVLAQMGHGFPRQHWNHQELVRQRHAAYRDAA